MKVQLKKIITLLVLVVVIFSACEKTKFKEEPIYDIQPENKPIKVNAGTDQTIHLPTNTATLDGNNSTGANDNINSYLWTKISGPSSFSIVNSNAVQTQVTNLVEGVYQFEMKLTTAGSYSVKDTVSISVRSDLIGTSCSKRPEVNVTLTPVGNLSTARFGLVCGTAGTKILFAGGWESGIHSTRVDIYDTVSRTWSIAELTQAERDGMAVASVGSKILFAGGGNNDWVDVTSRVDIYDALTNTWSTAELSQARNYLSAVSLGNKVFFAGGGIWGPMSPSSTLNYHIGSTVVDIYDNSTGTWSTANLSEGRYELSAAAVGNKIYFGGGLYNMFRASDKIDIYDVSLNTWTTSQLHEIKASAAVVSFGNKIVWAGGATNSYQSGYPLSSKVEIKDVVSNESVVDCILPKAMFKAIIKDDYIVFFTGYNNGAGNKIDIYNTKTNAWVTGVLPVTINGAAIIAVNNNIYVAGGKVNGNFSSQVWKLEF